MMKKTNKAKIKISDYLDQKIQNIWQKSTFLVRNRIFCPNNPENFEFLFEIKILAKQSKFQKISIFCLKSKFWPNNRNSKKILVFVSNQNFGQKKQMAPKTFGQKSNSKFRSVVRTITAASSKSAKTTYARTSSAARPSTVMHKRPLLESPTCAVTKIVPLQTSAMKSRAPPTTRAQPSTCALTTARVVKFRNLKKSKFLVNFRDWNLENFSQISKFCIFVKNLFWEK